MSNNQPHFIKQRFYPVVVLVLCSFFLMYKYILQVYPNVMKNDLMRAFHVYGTGFGNLAATFFYSYLIMQLFAGYLLNRYSTRWLSGVSILVSAMGAYVFFHAYSLWTAEIARLLMGVGAAFATICYMKMASIWFHPKHFAFVGGLLSTAAMLGAIVAEAPLAVLINHIGWRDSLLWAALAGILLAIAVAVILRDRPKKLPPHVEVTLAPPKARAFWAVMLKSQNWLLTFYSGLTFAPIAVFGGLWGTSFLQEAHQYSRTESASIISAVFLGLAIGGPLLGWFSDYIRNRRLVMFAGSLMALIGLSAVIYFPYLTVWMITFLLFIFGLGTGAFMLGFAVGKELNPLALTATVIALINTGDAVFGAFTEPLVGKFLDWDWGRKIVAGVHYFSPHDYRVAFLVLPTYLLLSILLVYFIKEKEYV